MSIEVGNVKIFHVTGNGFDDTCKPYVFYPILIPECPESPSLLKPWRWWGYFSSMRRYIKCMEDNGKMAMKCISNVSHEIPYKIEQFPNMGYGERYKVVFYTDSTKDNDKL